MVQNFSIGCRLVVLESAIFAQYRAFWLIKLTIYVSSCQIKEMRIELPIP